MTTTTLSTIPYARAWRRRHGGAPLPLGEAEALRSCLARLEVDLVEVDLDLREWRGNLDRVAELAR